MAKAISYLKKGTLDGECHPSRCGNKDVRRRNDAFGLWGHLIVVIFEEDCEKNIKALGYFEDFKTLKVLQIRA